MFATDVILVFDCARMGSLFSASSDPVLAERSQSRQRLAILLPIRRGLAGDNIIDVANRESLNFHVTTPRLLKSFNAVGGKDQV